MSVNLGNLSHSLTAAVIQTVSSSPLLTVAFPGQEVMSSSSTSRWLVEDPEWAGFNDTETIGCFTSVMCQVKVGLGLVYQWVWWAQDCGLLRVICRSRGQWSGNLCFSMIFPFFLTNSFPSQCPFWTSERDYLYSVRCVLLPV